MATNRPTLGLALSGSGNRTSFYIGFLEILDEAGIEVDYISASSGGSLVAAAYACGKMEELKNVLSEVDNGGFKRFVSRAQGKGGLYSLDRMEEELRLITRGLRFEEVRIKMSFDAVDIENGERIILCMGDLARAARISCTLPGIFEPVQWGSRMLVDGGLLSTIPLRGLRNFNPDVTVGIHMRGTKYLFTPPQLTFKKIVNLFKTILFVDEIGAALHYIFGNNSGDEEFVMESPGIFSVLGKSMDLALAESKNPTIEDLTCDLLISPNIPTLKRSNFMQFSPYYEAGRDMAQVYIVKIRDLIAEKEKIKQ